MERFRIWYTTLCMYISHSTTQPRSEFKLHNVSHHHTTFAHCSPSSSPSISSNTQETLNPQTMLSLRFPLPPPEPKLSSLPKSTPISIKSPPSRLTPSRLSLFDSTVSASVEEELRSRTTDARVPVEAEEEREGVLPSGLRREFMPNHVAVIMDGNVRWARKRGSPSSVGHEAGVRSLKQLIQLCCEWGITVLTVFAFSYDNWNRPKMEIEFLMSLFERGVESELENFVREGIQVSVIGDSSKLPESLQRLIPDIEKSTKSNLRLQLIVAVSYSGQYDIVQACQKIAEKAKDGLILPEDINASHIEQELETNCAKFPYPDLLIRTSGEVRLSNFLLWQLAYTELFFAQSLWPDFGEAEFVEALLSFQQRQRRYGGRDSQINRS